MATKSALENDSNQWVDNNNLNDLEEDIDIQQDDSKNNNSNNTRSKPNSKQNSSTDTKEEQEENPSTTSIPEFQTFDELNNITDLNDIDLLNGITDLNDFDLTTNTFDDDSKQPTNNSNSPNTSKNTQNTKKTAKNAKNTKNTKNSGANPKPIKFEPLSARQMSAVGKGSNSSSSNNRSYRAIRVPGPRMIHIRRMWKQICDPIVTQLKLQIRMNSKKNLIEIRTSMHTTLNNAIQKGADFIKACVLGFEIKDSIALIRMDDIYLESFDIRDVKFFNKKSDHWLRAIGRIAGQYGKIKYSIENSTNTRIVIFGFKVHILGSFTSIRLARNAISRLVMGSAPGNVYANLRVVSNRMKNRF